MNIWWRSEEERKESLEELEKLCKYKIWESERNEILLSGEKLPEKYMSEDEKKITRLEKEKAILVEALSHPAIEELSCECGYYEYEGKEIYATCFKCWAQAALSKIRGEKV